MSDSLLGLLVGLLSVVTGVVAVAPDRWWGPEVIYRKGTHRGANLGIKSRRQAWGLVGLGFSILGVVLAAFLVVGERS